MNPLDSHEVLDAVKDVFGPESIELRVCGYVLESLRLLGDQFDGLRLGEVAAALELTSQSECQRVVRALDYLSFGQEALLERRFEYWPDGSASVLEDPIPLAAAVVRDALLDGVLHDPRDGAPVHNFVDSVTLIYELSDQTRERLGVRP